MYFAFSLFSLDAKIIAEIIISLDKLKLVQLREVYESKLEKMKSEK